MGHESYLKNDRWEVMIRPSLLQSRSPEQETYLETLRDFLPRSLLALRLDGYRL